MQSFEHGLSTLEHGKSKVSAVRIAGHFETFIIFCSLWIVIQLTIWVQASAFSLEHDPDPVTLKPSEMEMPVSEVPFPAITICPGARIRPDFLNLSAILERLPSINYRNASDLSIDE